MLWNWNTVDSCFVSSTWHVTSPGMFAGSCIGVIFLVILLEFLRRAVQEYDRFLARQHGAWAAAAVDVKASSSGPGGGPSRGLGAADTPFHFRPTVLQQGVRALLHTMQFAVAYFVML